MIGFTGARVNIERFKVFKNLARLKGFAKATARDEQKSLRGT